MAPLKRVLDLDKIPGTSSSLPCTETRHFYLSTLIPQSADCGRTDMMISEIRQRADFSCGLFDFIRCTR
jgi:hypothetical protein